MLICKYAKRLCLTGIMMSFPVLISAGVYTVKKNDTFWDLSGQYLGNPYDWNKIWEVNPNVQNPHWIYPGDVINIPGMEGVSDGYTGSSYKSFIGGGDTVSTAYIVSQKGETVRTSMTSLKYTGYVTESQEYYIPDSTTSLTSALSTTQYDWASALLKNGKIGVDVQREAPFIDAGDLESYGRVNSGRSDSLFHVYDEIPIAISGVSVGDSIDIIRKEKVVKLSTGKAYQLQRVGIAVVRSTKSKDGVNYAYSELVKSWSTVENGMLASKMKSFSDFVIDDVSAVASGNRAKIISKSGNGYLDLPFRTAIISHGQQQGAFVGAIYTFLTGGTNEKVYEGVVIATEGGYSAVLLKKIYSTAKNGGDIEAVKTGEFSFRK